MAGDVSVCDRCSDNFIVNNKSIKCNLCRKSVHPVCVGLKDDFYKSIVKNENVFWFCDQCKQNVVQKLSASISDKQNVNTGSETERLSISAKEIECLQREKILLNKLLEEMECSNGLLKSKVSHLENMVAKNTTGDISSFSSTSPSYSSIVKKPVNNDSHVLLVKSNELSTNCDVVNILKKSVNPADLNVCVNGTKKTRDGAVIYCKDVADLSKLKDEITHKFGNKFNVREAQKLQPRILVKNVNIKDDLSNEAIVENIISLNNLGNIEITDIRVVTKFSVSNKINLVLEVTPTLHQRLLKDGYIWIGWQKSIVADNVYALQCFKCHNFGHHAKNCSNSVVCKKCSEKHDTKDCNVAESICSNCKNYNIKYKTKIDINHSVKDKKCLMYINYLKNIQSRINYG